MDIHADARYHVHGQTQPDDAGKLITVKAVRSVWRGPVGIRSSNATFVGWLPYTKEHRQLAGLPKEHCFDAAVIATRGRVPSLRTTTLLAKRCLPDGDYQQTKGRHSEQRIITGKIRGFRKFDKVRYQGQEYFIKGRMSAGYAILMDVDGNKIDLKPIPKFEQMMRVSARASWSMSPKPMPNISSSIT
jgi:hypothetical protein